MLWGYNEQDNCCIELKNKIRILTKKAIQNVYNYFISGMALGCDTYFSEIILELKELYPHIYLECAIPYKEQAAYWEKQYKERYLKIIEKSDKKTLLSHQYYHGCLLDRNRYMVDNSNLLIAVYKENENGGTKSTINYAQKLKKQIILIQI